MPRPSSHPLPRYMVRQGDRFWARRAVPADLRDIVGSNELWTPLGPDRREAEAQLRLVAADHERTIRRAREQRPRANQRPQRSPAFVDPIPIRQLGKMHELYELRADTLRRDRGERSDLIGGEHKPWGRIAAGRAIGCDLETLIVPVLARYRADGLTTIKPGDPEFLPAARAIATAHLKVLRDIIARDQGDLDALSVREEDTEGHAIETGRTAPVSIRELFRTKLQRMREENAAPTSIKHYERYLQSFETFIGHDDAAKVTKADLFRWIETLKPTMSLRSIKTGYAAGVRAAFAIAVREERIPSNPAADLGLKAERVKRTRSQGYTDDEAALILKACRNYKRQTYANGNVEPVEQANARRWMPVLCAYTGSRVGEIAQLRREDVNLDAPIPFIHITPEAGTVKTGGYRDVPIHPAIAGEFAAFVRTIPAGRLFVSKRSTPKSVASKMGAFIKGLFDEPPAVSPNHAWRHRFKTLAREAEIDPRVTDAIQGHAAKTAGDDYGDVSLTAKAKALARMEF